MRRLVPHATVIGHMRNRVYEPFTGRFLQRDMNATASVVLGAAGHSGRAMSAAVSAFDGMALYGDGASLYGYLGGSPRGRRDELGLRFGADLLGEAIMFGVRGVRGGLEGMTGEYAANQEYDLDWALDWSQPDDRHSRGNNDWVQASFNEGMLGGFLDAFDDLTYGVFAESEVGPAMARGPSKVVKHAAKVRKATTGFGAWLTKGPKDVFVNKLKKDCK